MKNCSFAWFAAMVLLAVPLVVSAQNEAPATAKKIRIVLVGDSTVNDGGGWGYGFKQFLTGDVECINTAANGRSSKSFIAEGKWTNALALKGDYYLIQFGGNDEPGKGPDRETDPATTYPQNLARYVDETRAIGAKPILVTSLTRRNFDKAGSGKIVSTLTPYVEAMKRLAAEKNVPLIDLHASSIAYCEKIGPVETAKLNPVTNGKPDTAHLNKAGKMIFAQLVVEELRKVVPELAPYLLAQPNPTTVAGSSPAPPDAGDAQPARAYTAPALPEIPGKIFSVTDYGAVGDGVATNTRAIQAAITAASDGGGVVEIPAGIFLCGPIRMASRINLHLDAGAILRMLPLEKYPGGTANPESFISGGGLHDVAISGAGAIDGQGAPWWPYAKSSMAARRPRMIALSNCERLLIQGLTLSNSPMFHIALGGKCAEVTVRGVTIRAPASTDAVQPSHNTDACDVKGRHVLIENCDVSVGDDNFTCGGDTSDVLITNCTYGFGHGVSIGSYTQGGVSNITVVNCTFHDTEAGIRIKSDRTRGGVVESCTYSNLTMKNVKVPIYLTAYYPKIPATDSARSITARTPIYRNIRFANLTATSPQSAGFIVGLPECAVSNVVLENVRITAPKGLTLRNANPVRLKDTTINAAAGPPFILETNAVVVPF